MRPRLKIYTGDDATVGGPDVRVKFGDLCDGLLDALRSRRSWVRDFEDDDVAVSSDLYEILCAYRELRPGA